MFEQTWLGAWYFAEYSMPVHPVWLLALTLGSLALGSGFLALTKAPGNFIVRQNSTQIQESSSFLKGPLLNYETFLFECFPQLVRIVPMFLISSFHQFFLWLWLMRITRSSCVATDWPVALTQEWGSAGAQGPHINTRTIHIILAAIIFFSFDLQYCQASFLLVWC